MRRSTWIILGLVVVLGLLYLLTRENQVSVGVKRLKLPTFTAGQVTRIEIKAKEPVVLVKENDNWRLELKSGDKTRFVRADHANVNSMLDAASQLRHSHYVTNLKEKLPELGLEGEEAVDVKIFTGDEVAWNLILGKNATGSGRYAKLPSENDVYVVRGSFWQLTRNGLIDWRDREIMPIKEGEISSFKLLKGKDPHIVLTKAKEGDEWRVDESQKALPKGFRVDKNALASLVRAALNLRASSFVDEARELSSPLITIEVMAQDKKSILEFFKGSNENYLVKRSDDDQIYEISKFNFDRVNKQLEELRDLSVLNFEKENITAVKLVHGKEHVVVSKKDNQWQIEQPTKLPDGFEFDPIAVDDVLALLSGLAASRVSNANDQPQNAKWQTIPLVELTTAKGEKINFYAGKTKSKNDEYLVKGNIDQQIYIVKGARLASLMSGLNAFKKESFDLPPIDENTKGFESLPVDVQRKLLDATKNKK